MEPKIPIQRCRLHRDLLEAAIRLYAIGKESDKRKLIERERIKTKRVATILKVSLTRPFVLIFKMLIRVGVFPSHILFHTDEKDFKDVGVADYAYRLSTALQGRVLCPPVTRMAICFNDNGDNERQYISSPRYLRMAMKCSLCCL